MLIRALIVLLIVLNAGVAAWWISRPEPPLAPPPAQPAGVPRLQLLSEGKKPSAPAPTSSPASAPSAPASTPSPPANVAATEPAAPAQCFSVGPFADQAAAGAAATRIGSQISRSTPRAVPGKTAQGYNVILPPQTDREAAQALAQRIGAAGFDDFLVVNSGAQTNGIALGRYRSREGAERRQSALRAAGFDAQLQPLGDEGAAQWWLDVVATSGVTAPALRSETGAAQSRSLDCALLR